MSCRPTHDKKEQTFEMTQALAVLDLWGTWGMGQQEERSLVDSQIHTDSEKFRA